MLPPLFGFLVGLLALVISWATGVNAFAAVAYGIFLLLALSLVARLAGARGIEVIRTFPIERINFGQHAQVELRVKNRSWLPRLWVLAQDATPAGLPLSGVRGRLAPMAPGAELAFSYSLAGNRRGYFRLGPVVVRSGDLFGVAEARSDHSPAYLTVYPKVIPLRKAGLPSRRPVGDVRARCRLLEDPTRTAGVRRYNRGDSLKQIHWKATAHTGELQSRLYEIASQTEVVLALDLGRASYPHELWLAEETAELAITVAASLACHLLDQGQRVGLITNGLDLAAAAPAAGEHLIQLRPSRDREQKTRILSTLARLRVAPISSQAGATSLAAALTREQQNLPWSGLLAVITPSASHGLMRALFAIRAAGFPVSVLLVSKTRPRGLDLLSAVGIEARRISREEEIDGIEL